MDNKPKVLILVSFACLAFASTLHLSLSSNTGFVTRSGTDFVLNGQNFRAAGTNNYYLWYKKLNCTLPGEGCVQEVFDDAKAMNLTVIRTWLFGEGTNGGAGWDGYYFQPYPGVYDEATFAHFDEVIQMADERGIRLVLPLVNNWNDFGGMSQYNAWCNLTAHDDFYTSACAKNLYKNYVSYVLNRINTKTGRAYKDEPTIFAWELANEPRAESDTSGAKLGNWIQEMSAYIKNIDSNHMVSTGEEGFYKNKGSGWMYNGYTGTDFISHHAYANIDYASYHMYPDHWGITYAQTINWIDEHVADGHNIVGKPVLLGEMGKREPGRDTYYQGWYAELESKGNNADLFWILYDNSYTNYDGFGVYCWENATTCGFIVNHANYFNLLNFPPTTTTTIPTTTSTIETTTTTIPTTIPTTSTTTSIITTTTSIPTTTTTIETTTTTVPTTSTTSVPTTSTTTSIPTTTTSTSTTTVLTTTTTIPLTKCWSGSNQYLLKNVNQAKKFCKCATGTYGYKSYSSLSKKATVYYYLDIGNNSNWAVASRSSNTPVYQVTCNDDVVYPTNQDYYR